LPGELYDADTQCKWQFGEKAKLCTLDFKKVKLILNFFFFSIHAVILQEALSAQPQQSDVLLHRKSKEFERGMGRMR